MVGGNVLSGVSKSEVVVALRVRCKDRIIEQRGKINGSPLTDDCLRMSGSTEI